MKHRYPIETERLILRPFTTSDIDGAYAMNLDAKVSRYTHDGGVVSRSEIEKRIRENVIGDYKKYGYGRLAVTLRDSHDFIGFCGLKYLSDYDMVDLGYRFMSEHWGNGYATEAANACLRVGFEELTLERIAAFVLPDNLGSTRVLDKLGFEKKKQVIEDGAKAFQYELDRAQWKATKRLR